MDVTVYSVFSAHEKRYSIFALCVLFVHGRMKVNLFPGPAMSLASIDTIGSCSSLVERQQPRRPPPPARKINFQQLLGTASSTSNVGIGFASSPEPARADPSMTEPPRHEGRQQQQQLSIHNLLQLELQERFERAQRQRPPRQSRSEPFPSSEERNFVMRFH
jgi:hypothetical protein